LTHRTDVERVAELLAVMRARGETTIEQSDLQDRVRVVLNKQTTMNRADAAKLIFQAGGVAKIDGNYEIL
jgi:hypothetical protein